jgi:hypothetical protein
VTADVEALGSPESTPGMVAEPPSDDVTAIWAAQSS